MNDTKEQSYLTLLEFVLLMKRRIAHLGGRHNLTGIQTISLLLLGQPRPMHVLKTKFNCDASNVTGIVDGLEQKGLATRFESPTDRRIKMVKLTDAGNQIRAQLLQEIATPSQSLTASLSSKEFTNLISLLQKALQ